MPYRPISARADGLLSLLGMKNLGRNPDLLNETVQPVLDAQGWYLRASAVASKQDYSAAFVTETFQPAFLLAAENEWLYVHYAWAEAFTGGGVVTAQGRFRIFKPSPGMVIYSQAFVPSILAAGGGHSTTNIRDIWLPPGFGLLYEAYDLVVATSSVAVCGLVSRIQV